MRSSLSLILFVVACSSPEAALEEADMAPSSSGASTGGGSGTTNSGGASTSGGVGASSSGSTSSSGMGSGGTVVEDAGGPTPDPGPAPGPARTLSDAQRRAFLQYYAPIILKRSSEDATRRGRDWITNFDFDNDQVFSNNKAKWEQLQGYVASGANPQWSIRPTLYTAMIEFVLNGRRDAILLYHIYHAKQATSIHDWERFEIRVNGINGYPGAGEAVSHAVITEHHVHNMRNAGHPDLNFMQTAQGKHALLWQAEEDGSSGFYRGELHFVEDSWATISSRSSSAKGRVDVNGTSDNVNFHYFFVPEGDPQATAQLGAQRLSQGNAMALSVGTSSQLSMGQIRRVRYELQDLADIFPTHWVGGRASTHWKGAQHPVKLSEGLSGGLDNGPAVPAGMQYFLNDSIDSEDRGEDRGGYPLKTWFWGQYSMFGGGVNGLGGEPLTNGGRAAGNGDPGSINAYWVQHDYFAHDGGPGTSGQWLPLNWHTAQSDGFDGRWVQLFSNAPPTGP